MFHIIDTYTKFMENIEQNVLTLINKDDKIDTLLYRETCTIAYISI